MGTITTSNENTVTRDTINKFNHLAPEGYAFAKKKMTEKATARLRGYWNQTVSYNEKKQDMAADTEHSQVINDNGEKRIVVVKRPTMAHVIDDHNGKKANCFYGPVFSTADINAGRDIGLIENAFFHLIVGCQELKIEGASLY